MFFGSFAFREGLSTNRGGNLVTKKKLLVVLLMMVLAMVLIVGCDRGGNDGSGAAPGRGTPGTADFNPMAPFYPPITVTSVRRTVATAVFEEGLSWEDNVWSRAFEEELGIIVDYIWLEDAAGYVARLNLQIASGDIPDLMWVYDTQIATMQRGNMLMDLTDVFETYATHNLRNELLYQQDGMNLAGARNADGRLMKLPSVLLGPADFATTLWIRYDWLQNVGLGVPTTIDEFMEVARAFTHDDPTGTGQQTFAMGVAGIGNLLTDWGGLHTFFEMFGVQPGWWFSGMLFYEELPNGDIVYSGSLPGMTEALTHLQRMFADGQIPPDFPTVDAGGRLIEDMITSTIGIFGGAPWVGGWPIGTNVLPENPGSDWVAIPPPSATGQPHRYRVYQPASSWNAVSARMQHPEAIIMMANFFVDIQHGYDGRHPRWPDFNPIPGVRNDGRGGVVSPMRVSPPRMAEINYRAINNALATGNTDGLTGMQYNQVASALTWMNELNPMGWNSFWANSGQPNTINHTIFDRMVHYGQNHNAHMGILTDLMDERFAIFRSEAERIVTEIIMGTAPVSAWDDFMVEWDRLGNQEVIAEILSLR